MEDLVLIPAAAMISESEPNGLLQSEIAVNSKPLDNGNSLLSGGFSYAFMERILTFRGMLCIICEGTMRECNC